MPVTYEPIATVTVGATPQSSISFTSIPGTYTDLVLMGYVRTNRAGETTDQITFEINSDTASNYSGTVLYGNGTSAISNRTSGSTNVGLWRCPAAATTANIFGPVIANFMNYSNTTTNKTIIGRSNDMGTNYSTTANVSLWRSTAAITSIVVKSTTSNSFVENSILTLYGIRAA